MPHTTPRTPHDPAATAPETPPSQPHVFDSADLFRGTAEIVIRHGDRDYRLRKTRLDKLILTA